MRRRSAVAATGAVALAVGAIGAGIGLLGSTPASAQSSEFYVDPNTQAAQWVAENPGDGRAAIIGERIASTAAGRWFTTTNTGTVAGQVDAYVGAAQAAGAVPIMVVYNMPNRDCGGASSGGAPDHQSYRAWIDQIAAGLAGRPATIVLEPDVLPIMSNCMSDAEQQQVNQSMAYAGQTLKGSGQASVYFDVGHEGWETAGTAAQLALDAGVVGNADGISVNVSNYHFTDTEVAYAKNVLAGIGDANLGAVVDTSRNGNGPLGDEWCDPAGRAIGIPSTTNTGDAQIDAFLWVKLPGEADGCAASAGQFVPDLAYELAVNAGDDWPPGGSTTPPTTEPTTPPVGEDDCTVSYSVNDWGSGFTATVTVASGADGLDGWTVTWTWPGNQQVTNAWNAQLTQTGSSVTAVNESYNGTVASGATTSFGFNASYSGGNEAPSLTCSGG